MSELRGERGRNYIYSYCLMIILAQKTKLFRFNNSIAPIGRMELAVEIFQVGFNGFRGDTELVRNLLVAQSFL